MRFHLFLLFFFSHHRIIYSTDDYNYSNQNNSSIDIDLYQCDTNHTLPKNTTVPLETIFNNPLNSCDVSCCISNSSNETTSSNICQVTVQSSIDICLGRLCYTGGCHHFLLMANTIEDEKMKDETPIINEIHSSLAYIPWSSFVNSTQTKWTSWIDKTGLSIRQTILILLLTINISLTSLTLLVVIKSFRQANMLAGRKSYRYTLL